MKSFVKKLFSVIYVSCFLNNTFFSLISLKKLFFTCSCGFLKFKGAKKTTDVATKNLILFFSKKIIQKFSSHNIILLTGIGKARRFILKELKKCGLNVFKIINFFTIPYNGCRLKKQKK